MQLTWDESKKYCELHSMQLATLESATKVLNIYSKIRKGKLLIILVKQNL